MGLLWKAPGGGAGFSGKEPETQDYSISPANMIWIFCTSRSELGETAPEDPGYGS